MKIVVIIARVLLGLAFVFFGLNGIFHFSFMEKGMKMPTGDALAFLMALMKSGYFYPVAACQLIGGALLLVGRYVALGLVLLGPVIVNIVMYHVFLDRSGLPIALTVAVLAVVVGIGYRDRFAGIFRA